MFDLDPKIIKLAKVLFCGMAGVFLMEAVFSLLGLTGILLALVALIFGAIIGSAVGVIWSFRSEMENEEE